MTISSNSFWSNFLRGGAKGGVYMMHVYHGNGYLVCLKYEKFILYSDYTIVLPVIRTKNTVENVDFIFPKTADEYWSKLS